MTKRFRRDELHCICALSCSLLLATPLVAQQHLVADPPQSAASLTLTAVYDQQERHNAFSYAGKTDPPLIRVLPGETIEGAICKQSTSALGREMRARVLQEHEQFAFSRPARFPEESAR